MKSPVFLHTSGVSACAACPGCLEAEPQLLGKREGRVDASHHHSTASSSGRQQKPSLPGWLPFLVSRDLSNGFGLGGRPKEEMLPQKIKEMQESICTLYHSTTTRKEWG